MSAPASVVAVACCALSLLGCSSVVRAQEEDVGDVRDSLAARTGVELAGSDDAETAREVERMLSEPLTDAAAVRVALLANPAVQALFADLGVATAERVQAGRVRNPMLDGEFLFGSEGTEIELAIVQPLLDFLRAPLRKRLAAAQYDVVEAEIQRRVIELVFEVRRGLLDLRAAKAQVDLARASFDTAHSSFDLMRTLHAAGNVTDPALSAQEAEMSGARLELIAAEGRSRVTRERLALLLGVVDRGTWTPAEELADPDEEAIDAARFERDAVAASLEFAASRARLRAALERSDLAENERFLAMADIGVGALKEAEGDSWLLGPRFAIELPIADTGDARVAGARARARGELERQRAIEIEVRAAVRIAAAELDAAIDELEILREHQLPVQKRLVTELLRNYNAMQIGVFDVFDARRAEIQALRRQLDARTRAARARIELDMLLAGVRPSSHAKSSMSSAPEQESAPASHRSGGH